MLINFYTSQNVLRWIKEAIKTLKQKAKNTRQKTKQHSSQTSLVLCLFWAAAVAVSVFYRQKAAREINLIMPEQRMVSKMTWLSAIVYLIREEEVWARWHEAGSDRGSVLATEGNSLAALGLMLWSARLFLREPDSWDHPNEPFFLVLDAWDGKMKRLNQKLTWCQ